MSKLNIYDEITNRIIEQLEQGKIPWHKTWSGVSDGAFNRVSKKQYSLLNQMLLKHDGEYASFKQWTDLGGKIKKGEKSEIVVFWKIHEVEDRERGLDEDGNPFKKAIPLLKHIRVFHISQVEGVKPLNKIVKNKVEPIEKGEQIINNYSQRENLTINQIVTNRAFYSPIRDYIEVPCKRQYSNINEFYSTTFHEMIHSTGHKSRLDRDLGHRFGSEMYSKEELVAEIGSAFLMNYANIETTKTFKNSSAYIQSWLRVLKNDNKFIVSASGKAEKSMKYILGIE